MVGASLGARLGAFLAIAALLVGLGAGTVWYFVSDKMARKDARIELLGDAIKQAQAQRDSDAKLLSRWAAKAAAMHKESTALRLRIDAALAANRDWADQQVPKEIQNALEQP
jgi:hypothetical protein